MKSKKVFMVVIKGIIIDRQIHDKDKLAQFLKDCLEMYNGIEYGAHFPDFHIEELPGEKKILS